MMENCPQLKLAKQDSGTGLMAQKKNELNQSVEPASETEPEGTDRAEIPHPPEEIGGPRGLEPTRYGDWERKGRCIDF